MQQGTDTKQDVFLAATTPDWMHGWEKSFEEGFVCLVHVNQVVASDEKDSTPHT